MVTYSGYNRGIIIFAYNIGQKCNINTPRTWLWFLHFCELNILQPHTIIVTYLDGLVNGLSPDTNLTKAWLLHILTEKGILVTPSISTVYAEYNTSSFCVVVKLWAWKQRHKHYKRVVFHFHDVNNDG